MSQRRKIIIGVLLALTVALAALGIIISNNIAVTDSNAETSTDFSNCDEKTGICTVPSDSICSSVNVYVHKCQDVKGKGVDCVNNLASNLKGTLVSGQIVDITDYIETECGTVQMYLESATSSATSVGACGSLKQTFTSTCVTADPSTPSKPEEEPETPVEEEPEVPTDEEEPEIPEEEGAEAEIQNSVSILSQSSSRCETNGDATISYVITFTNIGNQPAEVNSLTEALDSKLVTYSITPIGFDPAASSSSASNIIWNGPISINPDETKTYKYAVRIPQNQLVNFVSGITSQSAISYDNANEDGNSASFTLRSTFTCTIPGGLPNTGILDDLRFFIVGILFITLGYYVYKRDIGLNASLNFISSMAAFRSTTKKNISKSILNAAPFEEGIKERIKEKIKRRT